MKKQGRSRALTTTTNEHQGTDAASLQASFINHLEYSLGKDEYSATKHDCFKSAALLARDRMVERWIETQQEYYRVDAKRIYYLSLEFLMGRTLGNSLINCGIYDETAAALKEIGYDLEEMREVEWDAGLGNGGLGRLSACFLDSMATLELPGYGYGIRYEYGIFFQQIVNGFQVETPDNWLRYGNPWEFERPEYLYPVKFYGRVRQYNDSRGALRTEWIDAEEVMAMAYDTPIPGYRNNTVNTLRLWAAKSTREFNLDYFNHGDYHRAVCEKDNSEIISKVLYPNDNVFEGKELRLKQEYFFVSATLQDIIRRYLKAHESFDAFPDKVAIQLNDTHPAIAIADLMRILVDDHLLPWEKAWEITTRTFAYTNHTILPEALEKWPVSLFERVLPRHLQIIYEINRRFLDEVRAKYPGDEELVRRMSLIEEGEERRIRMAHLAITGSHSVNGVAALHSRILTDRIFRDFAEFWPTKFNNKTNGITQRRWLRLCNPRLSSLISSRIGEGWITNLDELRNLRHLAEDAAFLEEWREVKLRNKEALAEYIWSRNRVEVNIHSLFDCHVKRMHEYKRQLLNVLHVVTLYNRIVEKRPCVIVPRTVIFAGKAAPGYFAAKLIIKLINSVADIVNSDPRIGDLLRVVFIRNYCVSNAEKIIPAADLSEQISTAGTEASGTGNMKFALNGALTIGTLDGANVEIREEVGDENIFIFGLTAEQVVEKKAAGYRPREIYESNRELKQVLDMIGDGYFLKDDPRLFRPLVESLLSEDPYMLLADYESYVACQERVSATYQNQGQWTRISVHNVAGMGKFSTDRTIREYAEEIWHAKRVPVTLKKR